MLIFFCLYSVASRDEIAGCSEKAYDYLSIKDARQMLLFTSDQELLEYVKEVKLSNIAHFRLCWFYVQLNLPTEFM